MPGRAQCCGARELRSFVDLQCVRDRAEDAAQGAAGGSESRRDNVPEGRDRPCSGDLGPHAFWPLTQLPVHLGLGARIVALPEFDGTPD